LPSRSIPLSIPYADLAKYFWILIIPVNVVVRWIAVQRSWREHPGEPLPRQNGRLNK